VGDLKKLRPVDGKGLEGVGEVHLAQDRDRWRGLANT
jgi:hypothetical protein